jgi:hypothetical protein
MKKLLVWAARYQLDVPHIVTCEKFSLRTGVFVAAIIQVLPKVTGFTAVPLWHVTCKRVRTAMERREETLSAKEKTKEELLNDYA